MSTSVKHSLVKARVGESCLFLKRKSVDISTKKDGFALCRCFPAINHVPAASPTLIAMDFYSYIPRFSRYVRIYMLRGLICLPAELGMPVELPT